MLVVLFMLFQTVTFIEHGPEWQCADKCYSEIFIFESIDSNVSIGFERTDDGINIGLNSVFAMDDCSTNDVWCVSNFYMEIALPEIFLESNQSWETEQYQYESEYLGYHYCPSPGRLYLIRQFESATIHNTYKYSTSCGLMAITEHRQSEDYIYHTLYSGFLSRKIR